MNLIIFLDIFSTILDILKKKKYIDMKVFILRSLSHGNANIIYQCYNTYRSIYKLNRTMQIMIVRKSS